MKLDKCIGWYYNFKKGTEHCKNKDKCKLYENFQKWYSGFETTVDDTFKNIKDFRNCKRFIGEG